MDINQVFYFVCWNKNTFEFECSQGKNRLNFVPYYRSDIGKTITIQQCFNEGCEHIYLNGEEIIKPEK